MLARHHLRRFAGHLADAIWPVATTCVACGRPASAMDITGAPLCLDCLARLVWFPGVACVRCGRPLPSAMPGQYCPDCRLVVAAGAAGLLDQAACSMATVGPDRCIAAGIYDGYLAHLIRQLKYDARANLGVPLGALLALAIGTRVGPPATDGARWRVLVVPVPLHPARMRERGYNQAELIGEGVAAALGVTISPGTLARTMQGAPQASLDRAARLTSLASVFATGPALARPGSAGMVAGHDVLLVDDVLTTGATLAACSAVLRRVGARRVFGCTVAVGLNRQWWGGSGRGALHAQGYPQPNTML